MNNLEKPKLQCRNITEIKNFVILFVNVNLNKK